MAETVHKTAFMTLALIVATTVMLLSGHAVQAPFGGAMIALAVLWIGYALLRYYIAYRLDMTRLFDQKKGDRRITLPFLLEQAYRYDQLARDRAPYHFYHSPGFVVWCASGAAAFVWLSAMSIGHGGFFVPLVWTTAFAGVCFFILYLTVNRQARLTHLSATATILLSVICVYSLLDQSAAAAFDIIILDDNAFRMTLVIFAVLTLSPLCGFLKIWTRHRDGLAVMGVALWVFGGSVLFLASTPSQLLAGMFTSLVCIVSLWFRLLRKRRPYYWAYLT